MTRKDMYFDESRDTCKTAGEYQTAAEYWRVRERFTVVIQRFWRGYSARNSVWSRREEKWLKEDEKTKVMAEAESKQARRNQREMERRMNPTSVQDFEVSLRCSARTRLQIGDDRWCSSAGTSGSDTERYRRRR